MAKKLPPKNYDNDLNRRKQGLDQIAKNEADIAALQALPVLPTPAAGDTGKIPKVNSEGGYELGEIPTELPTVTSADTGKILAVDSNGAWVSNNPNMSIIEVSVDSIYDPTKITLVGMTATELLNLAHPYKDNLIVAKDSSGKALYFRQFIDANDPNQRSLNFFSIGMSYGSINRIFSFVVLPGASTQFNVNSKTI